MPAMQCYAFDVSMNNNQKEETGLHDDDDHYHHLAFRLLPTHTPTHADKKGAVCFTWLCFWV